MTLATDVVKKKKKGSLFESLLGVSKCNKKDKRTSKSTIYTNLIPFTMILPD